MKVIDILTEDTKAIILLCGVFGDDRSEKPLTLTEYSSLVRSLISMNKRPGDLLLEEHISEASIGSNIERQRLESLLGRGVQLGFAVEEWQRNGIWVISRSDEDYPVRYKRHLKDKAPPLLFGVGNRSLLSGGGMGIVGSRNVDEDGESFSRQVAKLCALNEVPVVSGGARGVDQISMDSAIEAGGTVIGILAENLLKKSVERNARQAIADGKLLFLSPYHPNARFSVGAAMGRNKLIYAMADFGLIVSTDYKKGGTWSGATEELKRVNPRFIFVRSGETVPEGNMKLLDFGAIPWPNIIDNKNLMEQLKNYAIKESKKSNLNSNLNLFDFEEDQNNMSSKIQTNNQKISSDPIYDAVLPIILNTLNNPTSVEDLAERLKLNKKQLEDWLLKAVDEKVIFKLSNPDLYQKVV